MSENYKIENGVLSFYGDLIFQNTEFLYKSITKSNATFQVIDLNSLGKLDSSGVVMIDELIAANKDSVEFINVSEEHQKILNTFRFNPTEKSIDKTKISFFENLYDFVFKAYINAKEMLLLTAEVVVWSILDLFSSKGRKKGAVFQQSVLLGVNAFTIISLMSLILGLILALQSAAQLRQFGANIFVADLLAISMVREMGPMMTAIIIAGRSGSSIASEIATMKVSEELDALKTMAINPLRYVIVPKFIAITFCMPLLVIVSIVTGIFGGLIIAVTYLDLSFYAFFNELFSVLTIKDITIGLSKSFFFAWNIVLIGAYFGLKVEGGAEGVGRVTTTSVVVSIFSVIIFDAIFSLFYMF